METLRFMSRKQRLNYLVEKYKFCHWCEIEVRRVLPIKGRKPSADMATVDHLKSRFVRQKGETVEKVLACYRCNQKRARQEEKEMLQKKYRKQAYQLHAE